MSTVESNEPTDHSFADSLGGMFDSRKQRNEHPTQDDYDPFEEFNRSAGIGVVENPYPMFALVRGEHPIKREDFGEMMVPEGEDVELLKIDLAEDVAVFTAYGLSLIHI